MSKLENFDEDMFGSFKDDQSPIKPCCLAQRQKNIPRIPDERFMNHQNFKIKNSKREIFENKKVKEK